MGRIPEDRDGRLAFLEAWAESQQRRLDAEAQRRLAADAIARVEEHRRRAEQIPHVLAQARRRIAEADSLQEVAAIPVVITKPSDVPADRAAVFADLIAGLRKYEWADPIVSECDDPRDIAPRAIDLARRHRPDARWLLYMEDDVILGPDFGLLPGLLREADELHPHAGIVSFFNSGSISEPGWSIHSMEQFIWLQCAAIRNTDYLIRFRTVIDEVVAQGGKQAAIPVTDIAVSTFLAVEYDAFALWCPSLVEHAEVTSTFSGRTTFTGSESYKQAYG